MLYKALLAQDSTAQKLDELITAYADLGRFNGSVLIAQHGSILLQKGYGVKNADNKTMNDANTIYQIASITKQFTAAIILQLQEKKRVLAKELIADDSSFVKSLTREDVEYLFS